MQIAMPLGGIARFKMTESGTEIQAKGRRVVIDPELWRPLQPSEKFRNLTAKHVQLAILQAMTVKPMITTTEPDLTIQF
jgi:hypothetical protein